MLCKECPGKVDQIRQHAVVRISPVGGKFKAIAGLFLFRLAVFGILDGIVAGAVGVVLGICAVGDHKNLHILVQTTARPERIPLIAVDLVERLPDGHPAPLQFHMNQRKAVDQNRHIVAVIMPCAVCLFYLILVDDLQAVVVDVLLVDQRDIFGAAIIPVQYLYIVFLNLSSLFGNMLVGVGNYITEKLLPLRIGKLVVVQLFQLAAEVSNQFILGMQRQIGIALLAQQPDKLFFQFRLTLVAVRTHLGGFIGGNNGIFTRACDNVERNHILRSPYPNYFPSLFSLHLLFSEYTLSLRAYVSFALSHSNLSYIYIRYNPHLWDSIFDILCHLHPLRTYPLPDLDHCRL